MYRHGFLRGMRVAESDYVRCSKAKYLHHHAHRRSLRNLAPRKLVPAGSPARVAAAPCSTMSTSLGHVQTIMCVQCRSSPDHRHDAGGGGGSADDAQREDGDLEAAGRQGAEVGELLHVPEGAALAGAVRL